MAKFLDLTGLTRFKTKIQEWVQGEFVSNSRKINGKALTSDVTLSAEDVSAIPASQKGAASGVAELDSSGKVISTQLPSYVDDVLEFDNRSGFPQTGEAGKGGGRYPRQVWPERHRPRLHRPPGQDGGKRGPAPAAGGLIPGSGGLPWKTMRSSGDSPGGRMWAPAPTNGALPVGGDTHIAP